MTTVEKLEGHYRHLNDALEALKNPEFPQVSIKMYVVDLEAMRDDIKQAIKELKAKDSRKGAPKEQQDDYLSQFNEMLERKFDKMGQKAARQLNARMKEGFSIEDLIRIAVMVSREDWARKTPRYVTPEYCTREQTVLNYQERMKAAREFAETDPLKYRRAEIPKREQR